MRRNRMIETPWFFAYPDVVVITGKVDFVVSMFQRPDETARDRLTTLWMRTPTGWELKLWQATPFPDKHIALRRK